MIEQLPALPVIGSVSGIGAADPGCSLGPVVVQNSPLLNQLSLNLRWDDFLYVHASQQGLAAIPAIAELCKRLATQTYQYTQQQQPFMVIGGDHSCAIGTWSGVATALQSQGPVGLIWIDAHMDSHTPQTTPSNNVHGMPLACLLGYGDPALTKILSPQPKLRPEHVCLIGVRSFESGEAELLKKLNVRIYFMDEIRERGLQEVFQEALNIVQHGTVGYGLSIDLDVIDPIEAPGVGSPAPAGITSIDLYHALDLILQNNRLIGMEIAEFNPNRDENNKTEKIIVEIFRKLASYINHLKK
ncbi:MAG: arginase [Gammaproteobacteria bacterium]